jgi:hypothetical protein
VGLASGDTLTLQLPFTIELDITRNTLTSANVCQIRIFNLSEKNRNLIRFNASDYGTFRAIELFAGYNDDPPKIFDGNISQAWSFREGVNFITQIECYDGGFAFVNGTTETEFAAGTTDRSKVLSIMENLPGVTPGVVGSYPNASGRRNAYNGNTAQILSEITGGGFFIDNGKANALGTSEYVQATNGITLVSSATGLLATPVLEQTIVRFDMIFEPGLNAGHRAVLQSDTEKNFNGTYKITGVKHRGMISESVCGSLITTGEFFYDKILIPVQ